MTWPWASALLAYSHLSVATHSSPSTNRIMSVLMPEPGWSSKCVPGVARPPPQPQHRVAHFDMSLANGSVQLKPDVITQTCDVWGLPKSYL